MSLSSLVKPFMPLLAPMVKLTTPKPGILLSNAAPIFKDSALLLGCNASADRVRFIELVTRGLIENPILKMRGNSHSDVLNCPATSP
ncbi:MAG: Uncharacterised protein [Methanobacteriota archaeon]|nr:MAG: Uncharacterised protein [Euryarchaeota archaeon]